MVPLRALILSSIALLVPVIGSFWTPEGVAEQMPLLWLLALIPAFLLAFHRGWRGVATALAATMAAMAVSHSGALAMGRTIPELVPATAVAVVLIALGAGWLAEASRLRGRRRSDELPAELIDPETGLASRRHGEVYLDSQLGAAHLGHDLTVVLFSISRRRSRAAVTVSGAAGDGRGEERDEGAGDDGPDPAVSAAARHIAATTRRMNLSCRYDEDSFLAVLNGSDPEGALVYADRILEAFRDDPLRPESTVLSVGMAAYGPGTHDADGLLAAAEAALRDAELAGGDRIRIAGRGRGFGRPGGEPGVLRGEARERSGGASGPDADDADPAVGPDDGADPEAGEELPGEGRTALVVSDDPGLRRRSASRMESLGFEIFEAATVSAAVRALTREHDLVVVDLALPDRQGVEIIRATKTRWPFSDVVAVVDLEDGEISRDALRVAADRYLLEPLEDADVEGVVLEALEARDRHVSSVLQGRHSSREAEARAREARQLLEEAEEQLRHSQKMEAIGQLTGGLAHDLKNLLTVVQANGQLLEERLDGDDDGADELDDLQDATRRGVVLINKLLAFSRRQKLRPEALDAEAEIRDVTRTLSRLLPETIRLVVETGEDVPPISADPGAFHQILMNLATNARDAMPDGGALRITLESARLREEDRLTHGRWVVPGEYVSVTVEDTGRGMSPDVRERLFEPFYTTKPEGEGTGLGLAVVYGLVKEHRGFIHVYSEEGRGTTFRVYLPVARTEPRREAEEDPGGTGDLVRGDETILVVEDEPALRRAAARTLERLGYRVLVAGDGVEALEVYNRKEDDIDLVFTDVVMPRMGGPQLRESLRVRGREPAFLFASGYSDRELADRDELEEESDFLGKPWTVEDLAVAVRRALDRDVDVEERKRSELAGAVRSALGAPEPLPDRAGEGPAPANGRGSDDGVEPAAGAGYGGSSAERPRALVVDDSAAVRRVLRQMLGRKGYRVVEAMSVNHALDRIRRAGRHIDVAVVDLNLPDRPGDRLGRLLRAAGTGSKVLYVSAHSENELEALGVGPLHGPFLAKPFTLAELERALEVLEEGSPV